MTWNLSKDPLEALQEGDSEPFEAFVPEGLKALRGFFQRRGAREDEAEDLAQDVLMKLIENIDRYRPDGRFTAFVFQVGRNAWIDDRRKRAARPGALSMTAPNDEQDAILNEPVDESRGPGDALAMSDEAARIRSAILHLPEGQRDVFELGVIQELGYGEIGEQLGIPVGTVKSRMFHALRSLRGYLGVTPS